MSSRTAGPDAENATVITEGARVQSNFPARDSGIRLHDENFVSATSYHLSNNPQQSFSIDSGCSAHKHCGITGNDSTCSEDSIFKQFDNFAHSVALKERGIPRPREGVKALWGIVESEVESGKTRQLEPIDNGKIIPAGISNSRFEKFSASELNLIVAGLRGCTSIIVVSRKGAWVSHLWESPGFNLAFERDVMRYLKDGRKAEIDTEPLPDAVREAFDDAGHTKVFIMTPNPGQLRRGATNDEIDATFADGDNEPLWGPGGDSMFADRLSPIKDFLNQQIPGVFIATFAYTRQTETDLDGGWGRAAILYSNKQDLDDQRNPLQAETQQATWECWMQGKRMGSDIWDATPEHVLVQSHAFLSTS